MACAECDTLIRPYGFTLRLYMFLGHSQESSLYASFTNLLFYLLIKVIVNVHDTDNKNRVYRIYAIYTNFYEA